MRGYCVGDFNKFDGIVVLLSIVELIVAPPPFLSGKGDDKLTALIAPHVPALPRLQARTLVGGHGEAAQAHPPDVRRHHYFALLLALFMYIYSLLGMQFFANRLRFDDLGYPKRPGDEGYDDAEVPRCHYDTLLWSFTTIFQILSGENWNANMYDGWRAAGPIAVLYYVSLITLGMFIVMNLFMAILLSNFGSDKLHGDKDGGETEGAIEGDAADACEATAEGDEEKEAELRPTGEAAAGPHALRRRIRQAAGAELSAEEARALGGDEGPTILPRTRGRRPRPSPTRASPSSRSTRADRELMMGPDHPVRLGVAKLVDEKMFDHVVMVLIIVSSLLLLGRVAVRQPRGPDGGEPRWRQHRLHRALPARDVGEDHRDRLRHAAAPYMRSGWNVLDFLTIIVSVIALAVSDVPSLKSLRSLRAMRALRPLRMIKRAPACARSSTCCCARSRPR